MTDKTIDDAIQFYTTFHNAPKAVLVRLFIDTFSEVAFAQSALTQFLRPIESATWSYCCWLAGLYRQTSRMG
jgi:hypothetical protein